MILRPKLRTLLWLVATALCLLSLFILFQPPPETASAAILQETGYPGPSTPVDGLQTLEPYPGPGTSTAPAQLSPTASLTGQPTLTPGSATLTPSATAGQSTSLPVTPGRDLFATENAEMGGARVTPPPSETPTLSLTASVTPQITPTDPGFFQINRRMFLIGLVVPLAIAIIGGLLYKFLKSPEFY
jgi:hypothetical protein